MIQSQTFEKQNKKKIKKEKTKKQGGKTGHSSKGREVEQLRETEVHATPELKAKAVYFQV